MNHVGLKSTLGGGLIALGLVAGTGFVSAHGGPGGHSAVRGTISSAITNNSFQVTPTTGSPVTVTLTATTKVVHQLAGTTGDLQPKTPVALHFATGTTAVDAIEINTLASGKHAGTKKPTTTTTTTTTTTKTHTHTHTGTKTKTTTTTTTTSTGTKPPHTHTGTPRGAFGTVVSFDSSKNALTITGFNGKQATYTLANNVTITKTVAGAQSDLAQGQTVVVGFAHGSTTNAALIAIIGA